MKSKKLLFRTFIRHPAEAVYRWHLRKRALLRGFPSWEHWNYVSEEHADGAQFKLIHQIKTGLWKFTKVPMRVQFDHQKQLLTLEVTFYWFERLSINIQFRSHSVDACEMVERIEYLMKYPFFFKSLREKWFEKRLVPFIQYRQETISNDFDFYYHYGKGEKKKILISGCNGLIGKNLRVFLEGMGHEVWELSRKRSDNERSVFFDDITGEVELEKLEGFDGVIHLRGQSIFGRWTNKRKSELIRSRVDGTKKLAHHLFILKRPPKVFLCASAIGIYGDRGDEVLDEKSGSGSGSFLSDLATHWEEASKVLVRKNIRVVHLRFGMVLTMDGGALKKMAPPIRWGALGAIGTGRQFQSWIAMDDAVCAIFHCFLKEEIVGPVNIVSPQPVTNMEMSEEIAHHYHKELGPRLPSSFIRLFGGQMGEELLLSSLRCYPKVLEKTGFRFRYPTIKMALKRLLP